MDVRQDKLANFLLTDTQFCEPTHQCRYGGTWAGIHDRHTVLALVNVRSNGLSNPLKFQVDEEPPLR